MSGSNKTVPRRRFLQLAGALAIGLGAYSYQRGVRFPTISLEPGGLSGSLKLTGATVRLTDLLALPEDQTGTTSFRAFAPEPALTLDIQSSGEHMLNLYNIAEDAVLASDASTSLDESIRGINRQLRITANAGESINLRWQLPPLGSYKFAAIGDTGGGQELGWCIERAHQLGARFFLHLGDLNYQQDDYQNAIELFKNAPLPCYVTIGNHDFHDGGLVHGKFLNYIGPLNHRFSIANTRFVNFDTAASFLPYSSGLRGDFFTDLLADQSNYADTVAFSHRPLHDPQQDGDHDIGNSGERDWLIKQLKLANIKTLLSGHIHIFDRTEIAGLDNIIVGQGLGHQDLIVQADHSKIALGLVDESGKVTYEFAPLAMPMELHCHPRTEAVKKTLRNGPQAELIKRVDEACR